MLWMFMLEGKYYIFGSSLRGVTYPEKSGNKNNNNSKGLNYKLYYIL